MSLNPAPKMKFLGSGFESWLKGAAFVAFFYFLAMLQTGFLVHFAVAPAIFPNLILLAIIIINFLESPRAGKGFFGAIFGGFFWDIFSQNPIGFHILILLTLTALMKIILRKYVRFSSIRYG